MCTMGEWCLNGFQLNYRHTKRPSVKCLLFECCILCNVIAKMHVTQLFVEYNTCWIADLLKCYAFIYAIRMLGSSEINQKKLGFC